MSVNKCIFIGRLTRDVEARYLSSGSQIARFSIAVNEKFGKEERVEYVNLVAFGKLADISAQYLKKGMLVYVEGRLQTGKYTAKDGTERTSVDIILSQMQMLSGKSDGQPAQDKPQYSQPQDDFPSEPIPF